MKILLLTLALLTAASGTLATPSAHAAQIKATIDCTPVKPMEKPLPSGWATLYDVLQVVQIATVDGNKHTNEVALKTRCLSDWTKKEEVYTDIYEPGVAPSNDHTLSYNNRAHSAGLHLDSVSFHVTKQDIPFTAGPVPPGTYPAKAVLTITTSSRGTPGSDELLVDTRRIEMICKYTMAYGF